MNAGEALAWLYSTQLHGIKLGLNQIERLVNALGLQLDGERAPKYLHVAGTNGKGSVCAMLDSISRAGGHKTGLFISPHLITFRERIRVNGGMIPEDELTAGLGWIREAVEGWEVAPTFFEIATALALIHFEKCGAEIVVLETGMGGRLDATNVITPAVSILTPIALDHQQWLGNSLGAIAGEKAGIIKPGIPVVSSPQPDEVREIFVATALERGAPIEFISEPTTLPVGLAGSHQRWNAALATRALQLAGIEVIGDAIARGLEKVEWPGRFQKVGSRIILDGAHNPAAALRLAETWREVYGLENATIILGILNDKDVEGVCAALVPIAGHVFTLAVKNERTSSAARLQEIWKTIAPRIPCDISATLQDALQTAQALPGPLLITGSLFLVGEALAHFDANGPRQEMSSQ